MPLFNIGQMPSSLPQNLIFKCPNQETWTYVDKVCDTRNDCGDCSDESGKMKMHDGYFNGLNYISNPYLENFLWIFKFIIKQFHHFQELTYFYYRWRFNHIKTFLKNKSILFLSLKIVRMCQKEVALARNDWHN